MHGPSLLILFGPETWTPTFHYNAETDVEQDRLQEIAKRIKEVLDEYRQEDRR